MKTYGSTVKTVSWYDHGYRDGCEGVCDAPMQRGNRMYENYMDGNRGGARFLQQERDRGDYYGTRNAEDA